MSGRGVPQGRMDEKIVFFLQTIIHEVGKKRPSTIKLEI